MNERGEWHATAATFNFDRGSNGDGPWPAKGAEAQVKGAVPVRKAAASVVAGASTLVGLVEAKDSRSDGIERRVENDVCFEYLCYASLESIETGT